MAVTGAYRIAIDPSGGDLGATPPFNRLVNAQHDGSTGSERHDQQAQEHVACPQARPVSSVEHAMIRLESPILTQAYRTQHGAHHATTGSQNGPDDQQGDMAPDAAGE
jgi:hypothetical protein